MTSFVSPILFAVAAKDDLSKIHGILRPELYLVGDVSGLEFVFNNAIIKL